MTGRTAIDDDELGYSWYEHADGDLAVRQYLTFELGPESYGVTITSVEEIRSDEQLTRLPRTPRWVKGILNLRGAIVPVIDLRERFDIAPGPPSRAEVIVVLLVRDGDAERRVGAVVDDVTDVVPFADDQIRPPPELGSAISIEFIRGLATIDERVVLVLDVDRLFSIDELARMDEVGQRAGARGDDEEASA